MKKLFIILVSVFAYACGDTSNQSADEGVDVENQAGEVEEYSRENITPQVDLDSGSNERLEVDTISSARGAQEEKDQ